MQLDGTQSELLKNWIVKRLEDISDADSDVLADYVLALVKGEDDVATVRANCIDNLRDFLQDSTEAFVDEVLKAIDTKSYDPAQRPAATTTAPPTGPSRQSLGNRKRGFEENGDEQAANGRSHGFNGGDRPMKQPRRGGRGGFDGRGRHGQQAANQPWPNPQMQQDPNMPFMPFPNQGMGAFDPQNPFAALMAMQQAMGLPPMPGMPQFPYGGDQPSDSSPAGRRTGQRCRDYDNKGFCTRGASCPYEHGNEALVVPQNEQYDPANAAMLPAPTRSSQWSASQDGSQRGRSRGRARGTMQGRGGGRRADFSQAGPNNDTSITAVVVEQIPEDKFDEQSVRKFFGQFGSIQEIDLQPYKRLAIIKYESYEEANAAYTSPKVIFDNRFVKVFWYKPDRHGNGNPARAADGSKAEDVEMETEEPQIDHAELAKRQEEAQRKHEEVQKQRADAQKQKQDIDAKLKAMEAERRKMAEMLAKKSAGVTKLASASPAANGTEVEESEQTKGLKAQLAKLEAEAKSLGIDPDASSTSSYTSTPWRGRGGFRGRAGFAPRGRGWAQAPRGGWAGTNGRGGAVKRLDNRPKTVALAFPSGTYDQYDEALQQYLLFTDNLEHATLSRHPERTDAALVSFEERYRAENFMVTAKQSSGIPSIGPVDVSWMANAVPATLPDGPAIASAGQPVDSNPAKDVDMDTAEAPVSTDMEPAYDVAEDDRWD